MDALTEEQQGGTAPEPEASASSADQASEKPVAAVAVADEPAESQQTEATTSAIQADRANGADAGDEPLAAVTDTPPAVPAPEGTTRAAENGDNGSSAISSSPISPTDTADAPAAADEEDEAPVVRPPRGPEPTTMEELLAEQDSDIKSFKHGDVVEGTVVRIDKDEMLVDIGAKSEGVVSNRELFGRHGEGQPELAIGDTVLVYVLQPESPEGHVVLSLRRAGLERKWRSMQELFEAGTIIDAPVIDHNKGGQIVDFPRRPQNEQPRDAAQEIAEKLQPYIGRKLRLKILEVNRKANRLILSEKVALYEERREKRDELFSSLQVSQKVTGNVRSIAPFGIFIDLGGIDGLVHKSELSWNKVNNPEAGYKVGDEVEAEVIDINHERGRISLSIRRLQPDPWESTVADFKVGDVIDGTVTKLVNFGAFVRVREGLEGLIHISELSHQRVAHPGDVVHEGQVLKLKIISLDSERHRLGLSLKQAEEAPARPMPELGAPAAPAGERRERRERRERPERSFSPSDALSEPEGGIDTTLAAAFAQVRAQLADAESTDVPAAPEATAPADTADVIADAAASPETPPISVDDEPRAAGDSTPALEPATDDAPRSQAAQTAAEGALTVGAESTNEVANNAGAEAQAPTAEAEAPTNGAEPEAPTAEVDAPIADGETADAPTADAAPSDLAVADEVTEPGTTEAPEAEVEPAETPVAATPVDAT